MTYYAARPKTKLTGYQMRVLRLIVAGNPIDDPDEKLLDMDQLIELFARVHDHPTTKQAMQFSIRSLITNGMIEKQPLMRRRGRMRVTYKPTAQGVACGADRPVMPAFVEPPGGLSEFEEDALEN